MKMKNKILLVIIFVMLLPACNDELLDEQPKDFFSPENAFTDAKTFQLAVNAIYDAARGFIFNDGAYPYREYLRMGTDVAAVGQKHRPYLMVDFSYFNSIQLYSILSSSNSP